MYENNQNKTNTSIEDSSLFISSDDVASEDEMINSIFSEADEEVKSAEEKRKARERKGHKKKRSWKSRLLRKFIMFVVALLLGLVAIVIYARIQIPKTLNQMKDMVAEQYVSTFQDIRDGKMDDENDPATTHYLRAVADLLTDDDLQNATQSAFDGINIWRLMKESQDGIVQLNLESFIPDDKKEQYEAIKAAYEKEKAEQEETSSIENSEVNESETTETESEATEESETIE